MATFIIISISTFVGMSMLGFGVFVKHKLYNLQATKNNTLNSCDNSNDKKTYNDENLESILSKDPIKIFYIEDEIFGTEPIFIQEEMQQINLKINEEILNS